MFVFMKKMKRLFRWLAIAAAALLVGGWLFLRAAGPDESALRTKLADALKSGKDFELLSIYARDDLLPESLKVTFTGEQLGGWRVLGKTSIAESGQRAALAEALADAARCFGNAPCPRPACFQPRHAIRLVHEGKPLELLICFECSQVQVEGVLQSFMVSGKPEARFDSALVKAGLPLSRDIEKKANTPPELWNAASDGRKEDVIRLLAAKADLEQRWKGHTPLHEAAWKGHSEVVALLLDAGSPLEGPGQRKRTPLTEAAYGGNLDAVKLLGARNANPRAADDGGDTVLHLATHRGNLQVIEYLLQLGADPNAPDNYHGRTPLHVAATKGSPELVKVMLAHKGDANLRSKIGQTPLEESRAPLNDAASQANRQETIRLLERAAKR